MKEPSTVLGLALAVSLQTVPAATITVTTTDNASPPGDGQISLLEALRSAQNGDTIGFNISGAGSHSIQTPLGGYPLISNQNLTIDGYTQPGSSPNTQPILGGNDAQIAIVLDSTGADSAPNPANPARPLRRSTRLDFPEQTGNTGYGETENAILGIFGADNVTIRGLSFIARPTPGTEDDPSIYCVALVNQAMNARVQGCWFGLAPGGSTQADLKPASSAVAAFRWRIGGDVYSDGLVFGTDGDGVGDRAEFNLALGCHIALALELPRARVSGNYFNVFPDGVTFVDVDAIFQQLLEVGYDGPTVENFENGRVTDDTVIGTDGNGVSDADERNIFSHTVYDHDIEFYSSANGAVIAGNYFGVGVDGVTPAPVSTNTAFNRDLIELPGSNGSIRIGSNGDGVSDDLEGNVILHVAGTRFCVAGVTIPIVARRNRMVDNAYAAVPFADGEDGRVYTSYYAPYLANSSLGATPALLRFTDDVLAGTMPAPNSASYPNSVIDLYQVDPAALADNSFAPRLMVHPAEWLASFTDNGPGDLDPAADAFAFDVSTFGLPPDAYLTVAVSYSQDFGSFNASRAVTGPVSNPLAARPPLHLVRLNATQAEVWWIAPERLFQLELSELLEPNTWVEALDTVTYLEGRNWATVFIDPSYPQVYYRLFSP